MRHHNKCLTATIILSIFALFIIFIPCDLASAQETKQENNQQLISLSFRDAELDYVLNFFSRATGYTIIKDADIKARVTIISQKDVTIDEALSVLSSILAIKGYATIINTKTIKVVPLENAKQENTEIKVGSDPSEINQTDTIVTQIMPLSYTSATQIVKDLKELVPKYGVMIAHTQSNTLIVTATSSNINRFAQIIKALDIPMSDLIKIEVFVLKYRDAETLATVITKIFEKATGTSANDQQNINNARRFRGSQGGPNFGPDQSGDQSQSSTSADSERLQIMGEVKVSADKTTNSIVVSASQANLKLVKDIIDKLDVATSGQAETRIFTLEHADASTMADDLNSAFSTTSSTGRTSTTSAFGRQFGGGGFQGGPPGFNQNQNADSVLGLPVVRVVGEERTNSLIVTTTTDQMNSVAQLIKQLDQDISEYEQATMIIPLENAEASNIATVLNSLFQTTAFEQRRSTRSSFGSTGGGVMGTAATTVESARGLTGNVKIVAESTTNSLAITTYKRNFPAIEKIIKDLDVMLPQVLIEVKIVEVTLNDDTKFGVEWMWEKTTTAGGKNYLQNGSTNFGLTDEVFGLKYGVINGALDILLLSLEKNTKVNILSTPRILTQDNHEATINIGQEVPYLESTQQTSTGGVLTSYAFKDVGVILTVLPRINKSETVTMTVDQQINSLIEFTLFNAPVITKREATAAVTVKDGQTMIIGGIIQDNKTETINKVPIISSIPLIGRFFQRKNTTTEKTELMVFITPHIIHTPEEADRFSQKQQSSLNQPNKKNGS
jgi:general secretion pathway protein D